MNPTCEFAPGFLIVAALCVLVALPARAGETEQASDWLSRFSFQPPAVSEKAQAPRAASELPTFEVTPARAGEQLVRVSLPFPRGAFPSGSGLVVRSKARETLPDVRVLTYHPGRPRSVRRAILSFPHRFTGTETQEFRIALAPRKAEKVPTKTAPGKLNCRIGSMELLVTDSSVEVRQEGRTVWRARLIAPVRTWSIPPRVEMIEQGQYYLWARLLVSDETWPRIIEVRADSLGDVAVRARLQRLQSGDGTAPDLGWAIRGPRLRRLLTGSGVRIVKEEPISHSFSGGGAARLDADRASLSFPDAHLLRRGAVEARNVGERSEVRYLRCRADERVPHQEAAWRAAVFVISPSGCAAWNALLEPPHAVRIAPERFDAIYQSGRPLDPAVQPELAELLRYHRNAIVESALTGDDFGNVTAFPAGAFGMNRLNHCPPIFEEYYRSGDPRLRELAVHWCENFDDLSIWWGTGREGEFGGTRYNNVVAMGDDRHKSDNSFMWRSNTAVSFCTKGIDSFFFAYEETGDPRMAAALRWQIEYTRRMVHAGRDYCRNVGDVADFLRLYRFTGSSAYLDEALRLFGDLRGCLSDGDLFTESGRPIEKDPPFIDDDRVGYEHPFAKPYIIGYALEGLPDLARIRPTEPKLVDVVRAVARFLAETQDPVGGWRYPHPRSRSMLVSQGMEHAAQLARAAAYLESRGEPIADLLDAIERALQARLLAWRQTGEFFNALGGWEESAGVLKDGKTIYDLYKKPDDRDTSRDYTEGPISLGGSSPEGIVYFPEVLRFYLSHRPAERLFKANPQLESVMKRMPERRSEPQTTAQPCLSYGMSDGLPTFTNAQVKRLTFPLAYDSKRHKDFSKWRKDARAKLLECMLAPPPAPGAFQPEILAREDRGSYEARKIAFNVSADCRIPAYLLVPKGRGPFPAIVALHDHGAHFSIGKEKVVRPFGVRPEVLADAEQWVRQSYGARFIGDELAKQGYVVFAADALFWGERGRLEGVDYSSQQQLAANLLQLGMCWSGVITWDDIRSAEFVVSLPEVDSKRIGAVGLSMGAHRTWTLCAASDRIACGAAICWMCTTKALMVPGNNQTLGQSAFSMLVPNLRNFLDYPDVASIACPKPMLFFNGEQDGLFPVGGVKDAYAKMRRVWDSQGAGDRLVTKLWNVPHEFNVEMQDEAFSWLETWLKRGSPS